MNPQQPIRVAVIGGGNMGRNHVRTYSKLPGVELVAIADIDPSAEELARQYNVPFVADYRKLLEGNQVDAVSIVVPTAVHHPIGLDFIRSGVHTLLEKPIASHVDEADELIAEAERAGIVFTVGHIERFNPMIQRLKRLVEEKEIGEITSIITRRVGGFPTVEPKTDVIVDLAVHDIDVISYLLGRQPERMYGHGSKTLHSHKLDSAELLLDYGNASGFIQANWITPVKVRTIAVTGTTGYVEGNYITQELTYYKHNLRYHDQGFKSFVHRFGEPEKYHITQEPQEPLAIELTAFLNKIRGHDTQVVEPRDARDALEVVLKVLKDTMPAPEQKKPAVKKAPVPKAAKTAKKSASKGAKK